MVQAIFLDIDGTLRDCSVGKISEETKNALKRAREQGILLFVATGRHVLEIEEGNLLEDILFDGYVTLNGSYCYNKEGVIFECPIAHSQVVRLMTLAQQRKFPCLLMERDVMYINMVNDLVEEVQELIATPVPSVQAFDAAKQNAVFQMIPYIEEEHLEELRELLTECSFTKWHTGNAYDITPKNISKEQGIEAVLDHFGLKRQECAAIGDGYNDISMIEYAGLGIAMGNGNEEIKEKADVVTDSVEQEGLANAIDRILSGAIGT